MKVIDAGRIAFCQGVYGDDLTHAMQVVRKRCTGVDKMIVVKSINPGDANTTLYTWLFKGNHGQKVIRHTFCTEMT